MTELKVAFGILGIISSVVVSILYVSSIFRGPTRPHMYTWLIWTLTQGTAVLGMWKGGGGFAAISLIIGTLFVFGVFLITLFRGSKNITKGDTAMLVCALGAIFVWWQLHDPLLAVYMVSLIDLCGYILSLRKAFCDPWSENVLSWVGFTFCNMCVFIALKEYNALTLTYLLTLSFANIVMIILCLLRRHS